MVRALASNVELERAIAEHPYDEEQWIVLEDWLLESGDPRGELVRLEKAGRTAEAVRARHRLHPLLFGEQHAEIAPLVFAGNWRAGYIREFHYAGHDVEPLLGLAFAAATRLCRALTLSVPRRGVIKALQHAARGWAHVLCDVTISNVHVEAPLVTPTRFAALPRLRRLALRGAYFKEHGDVANVASLLVAPTRNDHPLLPGLLANTRFPDLRELVLDLVNLGTLADVPALEPAVFAPIFERQFAPQLERFEIRNPPDALPHATLAALAAHGWAQPV